jgi:hypothetical protein
MDAMKDSIVFSVVRQFRWLFWLTWITGISVGVLGTMLTLPVLYATGSVALRALGMTVGMGWALVSAHTARRLGRREAERELSEQYRRVARITKHLMVIVKFAESQQQSVRPVQAEPEADARAMLSLLQTEREANAFELHRCTKALAALGHRLFLLSAAARTVVEQGCGPGCSHEGCRGKLATPYWQAVETICALTGAEPS